MRKIDKGKPPEWFEAWKQAFEDQHGRSADYKSDFPQSEKRRLREQILKEQGYICCYCMCRIKIGSSHLEHFWPKDKFPDLDMDYSNMLASCEGDTDGADHCGHRKNNWYDSRMVIPTQAGIESMFHYTPDGNIRPAGENTLREVSKKMIYEFGLDSFHLVRNRRLAIEASEAFEEIEYTDEELSDLIGWYDSMVDNGKYIEYCNAIIDVLRDYI